MKKATLPSNLNTIYIMLNNQMRQEGIELNDHNHLIELKKLKLQTDAVIESSMGMNVLFSIEMSKFALYMTLEIARLEELLFKTGTDVLKI